MSNKLFVGVVVVGLFNVVDVTGVSIDEERDEVAAVDDDVVVVVVVVVEEVINL